MIVLVEGPVVIQRVHPSACDGIRLSRNIMQIRVAKWMTMALVFVFAAGAMDQRQSDDMVLPPRQHNRRPEGSSLRDMISSEYANALYRPAMLEQAHMEQVRAEAG